MAIIDEVKKYGNINDEEDIADLFNAAEGYLAGAGIIMNESNPVYVLAVKMLVVHWHDHKEVVGKADKIAFGLQDIMTQLKYS